MKIYIVENNGIKAGEDYYDIISANSKDEALDVSMSEHAATEGIADFNLEVTELTETTCTASPPRVLSTKFL